MVSSIANRKCNIKCAELDILDKEIETVRLAMQSAKVVGNIETGKSCAF